MKGNPDRRFWGARHSRFRGLSERVGARVKNFLAKKYLDPEKECAECQLSTPPLQTK
jgi:hypothetical protein